MSGASLSPQQSSDECTEKLIDLAKLIGNKRAPLLHLFFFSIGLSEQDIEGQTSLLVIKKKLMAHQQLKEKTIPVLQYFLELIGISESSRLGCTQEQLKVFREEFAYASVLVKVCIDLNTINIGDLDEYFSVTYLKIAPREFRSCADLFRRLHQSDVISSTNLGPLKERLVAIGRKDIADSYVQHFVDYQIYDTTRCSTSAFWTCPTQESTMSSDDVDRGFDDSTSDQQRGRLDDPLHFKEATDIIVSGDNTTSLLVQAPVPEKGKRGNLNEKTDVQAASNQTKYWNVCYFLCAFIFLCSVIGFVGFVVSGFKISPDTTVFSQGNDTVIVTEVNDRLNLKTNTISECPTENERPHTNQLYLVEANDLVVRKKSEHIYFSTFNRFNPDCNSNLFFDSNISVVYMLSNSTIQFEMCASADEYSNHPNEGTLLIFATNDDYEERMGDDECTVRSKAALARSFNIGDPGQFECTNVSYVSTVHGYHYVVAKTTVNVRFYYQYSYKQLYLNPNDFDDFVCSFNSAGTRSSCENIAVSHFPSYLIVNTKLNVEDSGQSTHICFRSQWAVKLITVCSCLGALALVLVLLSISLYCLRRKNCIGHVRKKYLLLRSSDSSLSSHNDLA